jgi:hypothetical protein
MSEPLYDKFARPQLEAALLDLPDQIRQAETNLYNLETREIMAQEALESREAQLLMQEGGPINGKNAEIRDAQLSVYTHDERARLRDAGHRVREVEIERNYLRNKFEALKIVCHKS